MEGRHGGEEQEPDGDGGEGMMLRGWWRWREHVVCIR